MTLELATTSASNLLSDLETRSGKKFTADPAKTQVAAAPKKHSKPEAAASTAKPAAADEWWGDSIWKTHRNADKWDKPTGTIAPDQQQ